MVKPEVIPRANWAKLYRRVLPGYALIVGMSLGLPWWVGLIFGSAGLTYLTMKMVRTHNEAVLACDAMWEQGVQHYLEEQVQHAAHGDVMEVARWN